MSLDQGKTSLINSSLLLLWQNRMGRDACNSTIGKSLRNIRTDKNLVMFNPLLVAVPKKHTSFENPIFITIKYNLVVLSRKPVGRA